MRAVNPVLSFQETGVPVDCLCEAQLEKEKASAASGAVEVKEAEVI